MLPVVVEILPVVEDVPWVGWVLVVVVVGWLCWTVKRPTSWKVERVDTEVNLKKIAMYNKSQVITKG
jgi:hypothetical protein